MQAIDTGRREYMMPGWRKGLYVLIAFSMSGIGIYVACALAQQTKNSALAIMGILPLAPAIYLVALALRSRLVFEGTRIEVRGAFSEQSADFSEVEGCRTLTSRNGTYWKLLLKQGRSSITIENWFNCDELRAWLQQLPDLDERDRQARLIEIERSPELGATPEDRLNTLKRAKRWSLGLLAVAVIAAVGMHAGGKQWQLPGAIVLVLTPVAVLYLINRKPLLFALAKPRRDPRADLIFALLVAAIGLGVDGTQANFVSFVPILPSMVLVALAFTAAFYIAVRKGPRTLGFHVAVINSAMFFGLGLIGAADTLLDRGPAAMYQAQVIGKHITNGKSTFYYLDLNPWGPYTGENHFPVSQSDYQSEQSGDVVCFELHPGFLHAAWYERTACSALWRSPAP
jgi:hypothetical protein